jgi:hypothetical protein
MALAGTALLAFALLVAFFALLLAGVELSDNPCSLGDEPCAARTGDRVIGVTAAVGGIVAVASGLAAAFSAFAYVARPAEEWRRRWGYCAIVSFSVVLVASIVIVGFADSSAHR